MLSSILGKIKSYIIFLKTDYTASSDLEDQLLLQDRAERVLEKYITEEFDSLQKSLQGNKTFRVHGNKDKSFYYDGTTLSADTIKLKYINICNEEVSKIRSNNYKGSIVFHGSCLRCKACTTIGIHECYDCSYFNRKDGKVDKSKLYQ